MNGYLYENGSEEVEAVNSISGERCSPHPHVFSDRMIRPGDTAYFDIIHAPDGCQLLTRFPADQLYVAGTRYWTGADR